MAMHGISKHSGSAGGGGSGPVGYFISDQYYNKEAGVWHPRDPSPQVIEGDPELMIQMIDVLEHKHKYMSGVLSFTHSDTEKLKLHGLTDAIEDITGRLKEVLFAGIAPEHQHILIVAHTHLQRLELHYVLPRHNFEVDRAWNPAPPGKGKYRQFDALTDVINVKYGLDDPRAPLRARVTKESMWEPPEQKPTRETLNDFFKQAVVEGVIDNRQELIELARKAGFEITRVGDNYLSMKPPGGDKAIRLKGEIYDKQFISRDKLADSKTKSAERAAYLSKPAVARRYKQALRERQEFVEKRFKKALGIVRAGENHSTIQKYNNTKRGEIIEIFGSNPNNSTDNNRNSHSTDNKLVTPHDKFGRKTDPVIARAEQIISDTQQSTHRANSAVYRGTKLLAEGATVVKTVHQRLETFGSLNYAFLPSAPADIIAGLGESGGAMDSGDAEADKVLNKKRSEFGSLNNKLRHIAAANKKNSAGYTLS